MPNLRPSQPEYLFVYGTLRQGSAHPLADRLNKEADYLGRGVTRGKLYLLNGYPGMVSSEQPADLVHGDIYRLQPGTPLLQQLDDYEECAPGSPEAAEYLRRQRVITTAQGDRYTAWLYLYNRPVGHLPRIDNGDYFADR